jgi:leader peptidase (prepilin peptidase)/N-methyltransferase
MARSIALAADNPNVGPRHAEAVRDCYLMGSMMFSEAHAPLWAVRVLSFMWGCLWGSFVNVVIYRVPRDMSVVRPGSHCPHCGAPVAPFDNIPIVSWLALRGRARCCKAPISPRYAAVELLGGMLGLAVAELVLSEVPEQASLLYVAAVFLADFALAMALLAAAFIDTAHMYVPDAITMGGTVVGLATSSLRGISLPAAVLGAAAGFLVVWLPFVIGYKALRGRPGMGLGDAKLLMLAGAWFGWPAAVFALFAGAFQATIAAIGLLLAHGKIVEPEAVREDRELLQQAAAAGDLDAQQALRDDPLASEPEAGLMSARIPFGPFLCLATIEWMLGGQWLHAHAAWLRG